MAQISAKMRSAKMLIDSAPNSSLQSLHSSNPEPFTWGELNDLLGVDLTASLKQSSLAYASTQGALKLREEICHQYHNSQLSADDVVLISGAQEGIFLVMNALLDAGDEVICFSPCFEPLFQVAEQTGAAVKLLPLDESNQWQINWPQLEQTISQQTKLVVVNFPHNPTGAHITAADQQRLIDLCEQYDCWLFSDEVFRGLEHQPKDQLPAAADNYKKAISMGVVSKSLALPGIRLGWLTLQDNEIRQALMTIKSHLSICQSSIDTQLCEIIIPHSEKIWRRNRTLIKHNKKWLEKHLKGHPELYWQTPKAAATGFMQLKNKNATELAESWAQNHGFMVMPNQAFLTSHAGFRLTLGMPESEGYYQHIMQLNSAV